MPSHPRGGDQGRGGLVPGHPGGLAADNCPLAALRDFHQAQRQVCADLEALAQSADPSPALAVQLLRRLSLDLVLHLRDEDEALFPLLMRRAMPEDALDQLVERLEADHRAIEAALPRAVQALASLAASEPVTPRAARQVVSLARQLRRHMILENAVALPIAELRLGPADKAALLARIRHRRLSPPEPAGPCRQIFTRDWRPIERTSRDQT